MPPDLEWPLRNGVPMSFLAQLDLAELHSVLPSFLPSSGYLYFFYDTSEMVWGFEPGHFGGWSVLYSKEKQSRFVERKAPGRSKASLVFGQKCVTPVIIQLLPDKADLWFGDESSYAKRRPLPFKGLPRHQALGEPTKIQSGNLPLQCEMLSRGMEPNEFGVYRHPDRRNLEAAGRDWKLLLQIETDKDIGWNWWDEGTLYFWVRESDGRKGDFSKVWMKLQTH
jgi:uncharacterized protein YwqG